MTLLAGCGDPLQSSSDNPDGPEKSAAEQLAAEFDKAPEASGWLINTKHTLKGKDFVKGGEIIKSLLDAGASEIKASSITPDPQDPTFENASKLIVKLPSDSAKKSAVIQAGTAIDPSLTQPESNSPYLVINLN